MRAIAPGIGAPAHCPGGGRSCTAPPAGRAAGGARAGLGPAPLFAAPANMAAAPGRPLPARFVLVGAQAGGVA